jgi:hypothetical protein
MAGKLHVRFEVPRIWRIGRRNIIELDGLISERTTNNNSLPSKQHKVASCVWRTLPYPSSPTWFTGVGCKFQTKYDHDFGIQVTNHLLTSHSIISQFTCWDKWFPKRNNQTFAANERTEEQLKLNTEGIMDLEQTDCDPVMPMGKLTSYLRNKKIHSSLFSVGRTEKRDSAFTRTAIRFSWEILKLLRWIKLRTGTKNTEFDGISMTPS